VGENEIWVAAADRMQAVPARHARAIRDLPLRRLAIGIRAAMLQRLHERCFKGNEADRHGVIPLQQVANVGAVLVLRPMCGDPKAAIATYQNGSTTCNLQA
jgi:hypothetical protein